MTDRLLENWIQSYLVYTAESEAPEEYHVWTALSTIAGAMRRRSFFNMGYFLLYPNLYVVLVGPAGAKKSTSMAIGRKLIAEIPGINFSVDSITRERLILDMSQVHADGHSSMTMFSSELGSLLTNSAMDMVVFLTDIYESPSEWTHRTKGGGTNKIKAPCLNLIAATTPDWLARALPLDTVGIGLTSRIIFIYQDTPRAKKPFPVLSEHQQELAVLLKQDLATISTISGEYVLDPDAKEFYEKWYLTRHENQLSFGDTRLNGYFERKPMHVLKLCMVVSASRKNDTNITLDDLQDSFGLLEIAESRMQRVFSSVGKNPLTFDYEQALVAVQRAGQEGIAFGKLLDMFKHSVRKDEMAEVMELLVVTGHVKTMMTTKEGPMYFATE